MRKGVGEGNSKIWDLKYKISEDLEIKLKKCNNNYPTHNQWAKIAKGRERSWGFYEWEKECEMTIDKKIGFERLDGGEMVKVQNGNKLWQGRKQNFKWK